MQHGISPTQATNFRSLILKYRDIFRVRLGPDPPVDIPPFIIELKPDAKPALCRPRRLPPLDSQFLVDHFRQLIDYGFVVPNPDSAWASPVFCVPKQGENRTLRSVVDLRYPNSQIQRRAYPMPHIHAVGEFLADSRFFCDPRCVQGFLAISNRRGD